MFKLTNKKAIVTGGGSGIGQAISLALAKQGAEVLIWDLSLEKAQSTIDLIREAGGKASSYECNVADPKSIEAALEEVAANNWDIDILVNNAGIASIGSIEDTDPEEFDRIYTVNVKGVFLCMQQLIPHMKRKGGSIINIASIASFIGLPDRFAYSMSKGAVWLMTLSAAKDLLPYKIRVNAISPARVHTPFVDQYLKDHYPGQESEMFEALSKTQPIGRMGRAEEVGALAVYLASDEAGFLTGSNYPIDGGFIHLNT